jgi:DNA-binding MarR family transcriptional regulator
MSDIIRQSTEGMNVIFIHSQLDEAGLDPYSFRVYAHLARRAGKKKDAWPEEKTIAEMTKMSKRQVVRCMKILEERGMLTICQRPGVVGRHNEYFLTGPDEWTESDCVALSKVTVSPTESDCVALSKVTVSHFPLLEKEVDPNLNTSKAESVDSKNGGDGLKDRVLPVGWSRMSETNRKLTRVCHNSPTMERIGAWFRRGPATLWTVAEAAALLKIRPSAAELDGMERYYTAPLDTEKNFRRRDLQTLLNNWSGELDRARAYCEKEVA